MAVFYSMLRFAVITAALVVSVSSCKRHDVNQVIDFNKESNDPYVKYRLDKINGPHVWHSPDWTYEETFPIEFLNDSNILVKGKMLTLLPFITDSTIFFGQDETTPSSGNEYLVYDLKSDSLFLHSVNHDMGHGVFPGDYVDYISYK